MYLDIKIKKVKIYNNNINKNLEYPKKKNGVRTLLLRLIQTLLQRRRFRNR